MCVGTHRKYYIPHHPNLSMEKSVAELEIISFWRELESHEMINIKDLLKFSDKLNKLLLKCEELRKSRDNWRKRYEDEL